MCGVVGISGKNPVVSDIYDAMSLIQHRGQDAAGIATIDQGKVKRRKACGLVRDVFARKHVERLSGNIGIGHVRYPTSGSDTSAEAQPLYVNSPFGISLAHNGNIVNADALREELRERDLRHLNTDSDSEVLINVLAYELHNQIKYSDETSGHIVAAIRKLMSRAFGGFAVVGLVVGHGMFAFRDPNGIRPIVLGSRDTVDGVEYGVASEHVALAGIGFTNIRDLAPGEIITVNDDGVLHSHMPDVDVPFTPCIFEYIYLARPDSIIDNVSVYQTRLEFGISLGNQIKNQPWVNDIDVVIPIPDTGRTVAFSVAKTLNIEYREGFVKNRYIGRTFIMPGQELREKSVRDKLSPILSEFDGKNVLLVDDSIVRGTTSRQLVSMLREAGAVKVFFASAAPPVTNTNVYGINMPDVKELFAHSRTIEQMCDIIGADELVFQTLPDLIAAVQSCGDGNLTQFDDSCFSGVYITDKEHRQRKE